MLLTCVAVSECDLDDDDTTAECDGVVVDLAATAFAVLDDVDIRVTRTAIPAYIPTGTAGLAAISAAFGRISSFQAGGGASAPASATTTSTSA